MTQRYVGKWGNDSSGDGLTWATAYFTIGKALTDVVSGTGDQINAAAGGYLEELDLTSLDGTVLNLLHGAIILSTEAVPTVILGSGCTIKGGGQILQLGTECAIKIDDDDDVALLDIYVSGETAEAVRASDAMNLVIQRCLLQGRFTAFVATNLTDLQCLDTDILVSVSTSSGNSTSCDLSSVRGLIRRGSIQCRIPDENYAAIALKVAESSSSLRIVDVVIEANCAYEFQIASNPTIAVDIRSGANVVLDGCSIQAHTFRFLSDSVAFDIRTNVFPAALGVLSLTHRTTYDINKVSGAFATRVAPARQWYCERVDIEKVFGIRNVAIWADLDADEDIWTIQQRVEDFCEDASTEVEDILRGAGFVIPLVDSNGLPPKQFAHWVATLAGVNLYEARGVEDSEDGNNRLLVQRERVMSEFGKIASGHRRTTLVRTGGVTPSAKALTLAIKT